MKSDSQSPVVVGEASIERFERGIITIMAMHINCHDDASSNFMILHINHHDHATSSTIMAMHQQLSQCSPS